MSSAARPVNTLKPLNILWIETFHLEIPYDIANSSVGMDIQSDLYRFPLQRDDLFCFKVMKISFDEVSISCMRGPGIYENMEDDPGYLLRFYFSVTGVDEPPKHADMPANLHEVSVIFKTEYFRKKRNEGYGSYVFQLRVTVRMLEFENLPDDNIEKIKQNGLFRAFKAGFMKTEEKIQEMSFLLTRTPLTDIFSGRQNDLFVIMKLTYITRASHYSTELTEYFKMKRQIILTNQLPETPLDLDLAVILNYIHNMEKTPISNEDLIELFLRANRFGINFLKVIITFYIVENLMDTDFVVDALKVADLVDDPILLDKAMDSFIPNMYENFRGKKWKEFQDQNNSTARSVLHAVTYRAKYQELRVPAQILDYMQQSSEV